MRLTSQKLGELLAGMRARQGDTTEVEVKLGRGGTPTLGPTLCAFGNMPGGGTILIGLDEADHFAPAGVEDPAGMAAAIASQARTSVTPPVQVSFEEAVIDDGLILVVTVAPLPLSQRPCRHQGNAYLRQADGDYVMSEQEVQQLLALRDRPRHDAMPIPASTVADLDPDLTGEFLANARAGSRRLRDLADEEILKRKGVTVPQGGQLTLAGLYALGTYPQQFAPSLAVTAAVQLDPRTGRRTRDLVHLDGPLPVLLEEALAWVARNTHTTIAYDLEGHARDSAEIPPVAVRELVANSLVHRDLSSHTQGKRVEMRLTPDHLVISNPGGLWGINRAQLGTPGGKSAVNEYLYDICKLTRTSSGARVIEGEGGGIREAEHALSTANLRPAKFIDQGVSFTVLVPRHSLLPQEDLTWLESVDPQRHLSDVQRRLAVSLRRGAEWTNAMVREEFAPIDSRAASAELKGLVSAGIAQMHGERGQSTYSLDSALHTLSTSREPSIVIRPAHDDHANQPELPSDDLEPDEAKPTARPAREITTHGQPILDALREGPLTLNALRRTTGLTTSQLRYALNKLEAAEAIVVDGGWGVRGTTYGRSPG